MSLEKNVVSQIKGFAVDMSSFVSNEEKVFRFVDSLIRQVSDIGLEIDVPCIICDEASYQQDMYAEIWNKPSKAIAYSRLCTMVYDRYLKK